MESVVPIIEGIESASVDDNVYSSDQEASVGTAAVRSGDGVARGGIGTGGGGSAINDGINGHNIEVAMKELKATRLAEDAAGTVCTDPIVVLHTIFH